MRGPGVFRTNENGQLADGERTATSPLASALLSLLCSFDVASHFLFLILSLLYYNSLHVQPSRGTLVISASQFVSFGDCLRAEIGGERGREKEAKKGKRKKRRLATTKPPRREAPTKTPLYLSSGGLCCWTGPPARPPASQPARNVTLPCVTTTPYTHHLNSNQLKNETKLQLQPTGPRQKVGVDAADGQRQARVQVGARQDGRHRAGDRRVGQGQGRRDIQGAAEDGAGGGRGGQRQGERRSSFEFFFQFLFNPFFFSNFESNPFFFSPFLHLKITTPSRQQNNITDQDRPAQVQGRDGPPRADRVPDPLVQRDGLLEGEGGPVEDRAQDGR